MCFFRSYIYFFVCASSVDIRAHFHFFHVSFYRVFFFIFFIQFKKLLMQRHTTQTFQLLCIHIYIIRGSRSILSRHHHVHII